ncbi:OTU domain-containing protein [Wolbachia endosymbiont of Laodelphax striatellus]|uniref:hypothetical protein n=2 Tax=Wolbachia TaxID=953 RepID=UPI0015B1CDBF|nr:hypothetical protein [Wolbachia endosymbiont of Laodelphax striatellus]
MLNASCSVNHAEKSLRLLKQQTPYQTRLISEDISSSNSQQTLKLPEGFTVGKAIRRGGCFFDAVAQGLKQLKPETNFTVKSLREVCRKQALSSQEMKKKIIADARNRGDSKVVLPEPGIDNDELWKTYLIGIEYSIEDIEKMQKDNKDVFSSLTDLRYGSTLQVPIFGRPEIEGRMICNEYNVKLHVIENLLYSEWSSYLIDELGSRSVSKNYNEKDTIHIMNKGGCYFEPILRETPLMSEVQREFISIIEDSDRIASNKMNLSNQEETHQFKFLVVLSIVVKEAPHAVITGIFTGAISARRLAWFWRNGQIIDGVLRLPRLGDCIISTVPS